MGNRLASFLQLDRDSLILLEVFKLKNLKSYYDQNFNDQQAKNETAQVTESNLQFTNCRLHKIICNMQVLLNFLSNLLKPYEINALSLGSW